MNETARLWGRWTGWSAIAVAVATGLLMVTIIFGPELPEAAGNALIGAFLGLSIALFQTIVTRHLGIGSGAWVAAVATSVMVAAVIVQGPLEDTGWGLLVEGAAHAGVMGGLLTTAQYVVLRHRVTNPQLWFGVGLGAALVAEIAGRLVGLVAPPPFDLVTVFIGWQALVGIAMVTLVHRRIGPVVGLDQTSAGVRVG